MTLDFRHVDHYSRRLFGTHGLLPERLVRRFRAAEFELSSHATAAFELDGEWAGKLPAKFSVEREGLRVVC